jgi:hypothetical protein
LNPSLLDYVKVPDDKDIAMSGRAVADLPQAKVAQGVWGRDLPCSH